MTAGELIQLSARYSVARMLERDDFQKRIASRRPISIHEFLYPLIQGYDSVELKADVELGGTDQKFNLLVGRDLQRSYGFPPQTVMTLPLLEGTDGIRKMSKSLGNSIGLTDPPGDMYGKLMSINDDIMIRYFELLTREPIDEIRKMHPMEAKRKLGRELVALYHGQQEALKAEADFSERYSHREFPDDLAPLVLSDLKENSDSDSVALATLLVRSGLARSRSDSRRLIEQGGVEINAGRLQDPFFRFPIRKEGADYRIKVGKKGFLRVRDI